MKYLQAFSLEISHDYYVDQPCNDFQIAPTSETECLLKNYRYLLKYFPGGMQILIPVTSQGTPFIPLSTNLPLAFNLHLHNPDFALFTDTTEINSIESPLYTNNATKPMLTLASRQVKKTESFLVSQSAQIEQFILSGNPLAGLQPTNIDVQGLGTVIHPDAFDPTTKTATFNTKSATPGTKFSVMYPAAPQRMGKAFAQAEISFNDPQMLKLDIEKKFQIVFHAKNTRWKYYVITDSNALAPTIEDADHVIVFSIKDRADLTSTSDPLDDIANQLAAHYPGKHLFRFVSNSLIPCRQTTRSAIQLKLNGEKVVDALPNPSLQNYTMDIRGSVTEASLYQIVKYFAQ